MQGINQSPHGRIVRRPRLLNLVHAFAGEQFARPFNNRSRDVVQISNRLSELPYLFLLGFRGCAFSLSFVFVAAAF